MKKIFSVKIMVAVVVLLAVLALMVFTVSSRMQSPSEFLDSLETRMVVINDRNIELFIVEEPVQRGRGLSGQPGLPDNTGMLFVFEEPQKHNFWMKDMKFALDVVWFDGEGTIVDIHTGVQPESYPETFTSLAPAQYVIEIPTGTIDEWDIGIGETLPIFE